MNSVVLNKVIDICSTSNIGSYEYNFIIFIHGHIHGFSNGIHIRNFSHFHSFLLYYAKTSSCKDSKSGKGLASAYSTASSIVLTACFSIRSEEHTSEL